MEGTHSWSARCPPPSVCHRPWLVGVEEVGAVGFEQITGAHNAVLGDEAAGLDLSPGGESGEESCLNLKL